MFKLFPLLIVAVGWLLVAAEDPAPAPIQQPIAYSHKKHIALGLKCKECHTNPEPGETMTFPVTSKCMACHQTIKKDSPEIQKLAGFHNSKQPVPWVRVYQIPNNVLWTHRTHLDAGAKCEQCHGQVAQRDVLFKEVTMNMGACMNCHRENKASNDCATCHGQQ